MLPNLSGPIINPNSPDPYNAQEIERNILRYKTLKGVLQEKARYKHLNFIDYMWNNPSEPFTIGYHTRLICSKIDQAIERYKKHHSTFLVMAVPFRHGKAFRIDTPILTLLGWKNHGDVKPGDFVFDPNGDTREVIGVTPKYPHHHKYKITFAHGEEIWTSGEHEWPILYKTHDGRWFDKGIMETKDIKFRRHGTWRNHEVWIDRSKDINLLALHQGGIVIPGERAQIKRIDIITGQQWVNCIQVEKELYCIGKGLIPTHNSEIISRKLPAHFLGLFPDGKVLMTGHTASLAVGYSKESRNLLMTDRYHDLFPNTELNPFDSSASHWKVSGRNGEVFACGLGGSMAGQGYTLGIVDDYCRNREAAESPGQREKMWGSFTNDFLTRRAPRSITIITATPWHVDDIIGRIKKSMQDDPFFPKFEFVVIPAFSDEYDQGILFPERFNRGWYEEQKAALGSYGTASLLQCNPVQQGGNVLQIDNVKRVPLDKFPDIPYARIWDLAHTEKQRNSPDPDYTSGTLLAFRRKPGAPRLWELWIKDVKRFRYDAPKRDNQILNITIQDGPYVKVAIERSIDSRDAFQHLQKLLLGQRVVSPIPIRSDKVVRASALEPLFEDGDVYIPEGVTWHQAWQEELSEFPNGRHDDMVDNLSAGYLYFVKAPGTISVPVYET